MRNLGQHAVREQLLTHLRAHEGRRNAPTDRIIITWKTAGVCWRADAISKIPTEKEPEGMFRFVQTKARTSPVRTEPLR